VTDGTIPVALQPQQSKEFAIPVGNVKVNDGAEYFLNFEVVQNEAASSRSWQSRGGNRAVPATDFNPKTVARPDVI